MTGVRPVVRYLIICEEVLLEPTDRRKVTIVDLISKIRSLEQPPFPLRYPELCIFVQMADCRGKGQFRVEIMQADTGQVVFRTRTRSASFGNDPLKVVGIPFRIRNCEFPAAGLYWVQFWYNAEVIGQQPILLR